MYFASDPALVLLAIPVGVIAAFLYDHITYMRAIRRTAR